MTTHSFDTERVLGQIQRGEIQCGPDAARAIAARHQAAYGNTVWGGQAPADAPVAAPRSGSRRIVRHAEIAAALRGRPGMWQLLGHWQSCGGAEGTALRIRYAYQAPMYEPAGSFEARTEVTTTGCRVLARFVGQQPNDESETDSGGVGTPGGDA